MKKESGRHSMQKFTFPKNTRFEAKDGSSFSGEWGGIEKIRLIDGIMIAKDKKLLNNITLEAAYTQIKQMEQYFYGDKDNLVDSRGQKIVEFYLNSSGKVKIVKKRGVETPQTTCKFGSQGSISIELAKLFNIEENPFASPKPVKMVMDFASRFTSENDIILDFFSGSATTAEAIMELNTNNDNIKRKYILIQLQDSLDDALKTAQKDAKRTLEVAINYLDKHGLPRLITEIGKERIRRAGKKIKEEAGLNAANLDTGFKVYRLAPSNYKAWENYAGTDVKQLEELFKADSLMQGWKEDDLLTEIMLLEGFPLDSKIELLPQFKKNKVKKITSDFHENALYICLDKDIVKETIEVLNLTDKERFICLDSAIDDQSKIRLEDKNLIKTL